MILPLVAAVVICAHISYGHDKHGGCSMFTVLAVLLHSFEENVPDRVDVEWIFHPADERHSFSTVSTFRRVRGKSWRHETSHFFIRSTRIWTYRERIGVRITFSEKTWSGNITHRLRARVTVLGNNILKSEKTDHVRNYCRPVTFVGRHKTLTPGTAHGDSFSRF